MLQEPITPEKQKHLEGILDRFRNDAMTDKDVSYLGIVKIKGHPQIIIESGGYDTEKELLMGFFLKWALGRSSEALKQG